MSNSGKLKQDTKSCILESAAKLFSKLGLDRTSTRDISKQSHANISMISYHFGGKEGLYREVIKEFALKIQQQVKPQIESLKNKTLTKELFKQEVEYLIASIVEMRTSHPEISTILSREKIEGMPLSRDVHEEIFYPLIQNFFETFTRAQAKGIVRPHLNAAVFFILISEGVLGFFEMMECKTRLQQDCEKLYNNKSELIKHITDIFLTGALL